MKNKRILIVDTYYPEFVRQVYSQCPSLKEASYGEQLNVFMHHRFGTSDYYSRHLQEQSYDARDVIADNTILQGQWAREYHVAVHTFPHFPIIHKFTSRLPLYTILKAQIDHFQPDILYMHNISFCDPFTLRRLKKKVKLLVGQIASPLPPKTFVKPYDLILTSFPHFVERIRAMGPRGVYFKIGFDESILDQLKNVHEKLYDVVFIGGFTRVHNEATQTLENLAKHIRVDVWGYGIENLAIDSPLRKYYHGEAWGMDMYRIIKQAKICINRHSAAAEQYANNMRLYETTGIGTLLVTDVKKNLSDLFIEGKEVVSYQSSAQLMERIQYYLTHNRERECIAAAGQQRTLREHTYRQRMKKLNGILDSLLADKNKIAA